MRARLLAAAREVFERDGFLEARVTDISAAAGVAHGSFYTYFGSKTAVFRALVAETMDDLYASMATRGGTGPPDGSPAEVAVHRIDQANRRFVAMYRQNTALMALFEQVTDRKSTRLNSSHANISYAVFCLKKKNIDNDTLETRGCTP